MSTMPKMTSADLDQLPDDGHRYELIEGDLLVSKQPDWHHQFVCSRIFRFLDEWNEQTGAGVANNAPGLIFADDDDVVPDVVWISTAHLATALRDGKLYAAPELVVEVLSPGTANERRDREQKRGLYARRGVHEYWIVDWRRQQIAVYRRDGANLQQVATLAAGDDLTTPLLPGFRCPLRRLFLDLPAGAA